MWTLNTKFLWLAEKAETRLKIGEKSSWNNKISKKKQMSTFAEFSKKKLKLSQKVILAEKS